ncbi:MAG TPA: hypothetical protein VMY99_02595 [Nevskiaceae bacterium]|nr:hypothetical protein [Nevskiaceae bacterium]
MRARQLLVMVGAFVSLSCMLGAVSVHAQSSSTNYKLNEFSFGSGGELNSCSGSYCSKQSAGDLTVGNSASNNYQMYGGFNTTDMPLLEVAVDGGAFDFGILDASTVHTITTTFRIRNYLSSGYVARLTGSAPDNGAHTLTALSSATASSPGTEQFGVNVVDNSSPNIGADPQQVPDSTFGFGAAATGYNTTNLFKFVDGGTIANSAKSSGETLFTLSMIANQSNQTPAGVYTGHLSIVVVPTF